MWGKAKNLLLLLSLALNIPFIVMWAASMVESADAAPAEVALPTPAPRTMAPGSATPRTHIPRSYNQSMTEGSRSVYRDVGVTEEQWHEIEPRLAEFRAAMFRLGREMKRQRDELVDLFAAPELDYEAAQAKQEEILGAQSRMSELVYENMLADHEILTPQQQGVFFKKLRDYCGRSGSALPGRPTNTMHGQPWSNQRKGTNN
jgi:Spy/CpxP family protein refolding chaperone